jgi:hypothetical protein
MICMLIYGHAYTQQKNPKPPGKDCGCSFSSINQVGLLEGSGGSAFQAQTINGIRYRKWFAGLGIGLDKYKFRTAPLFLDIRRDLLNRTNTPFVYADIGTHLPWVKDSEQDWWERSEFNRGLYYDAGLGYKLQLGKGRGLLFSGGFSLKRMREKRFLGTMCINPPCSEQMFDRFDYSLRRFTLKAGIEL